MSNCERIAAQGRWGTVEWAVDSQGNLPARKVYLSLSEEDQAKVNALFQRLADFGQIKDRQKFKCLGEKAGKKGRGLWEFKRSQVRFFGDFSPNKRFVFIVAHGLDGKKKDDLPKQAIEKAIRIFEEHSKLERGAK